MVLPKFQISHNTHPINNSTILKIGDLFIMIMNIDGDADDDGDDDG